MLQKEENTIRRYEAEIAKMYTISLAISKKNNSNCENLAKKEAFCLNKAKALTKRLKEYKKSIKKEGNIYSLKNDIINHFAKFDILLKFDSRNLSEIELYLCFELPKDFFPFENLEDSKKLKAATKNLFFNNQTFDYCLAEDSKIELFNFEYYDF